MFFLYGVLLMSLSFIAWVIFFVKVGRFDTLDSNNNNNDQDIYDSRLYESHAVNVKMH